MIASLNHVKEILNEKSLKAKKKFGQNFLIDANVVDKIAKNACDKEIETIEIGPGIGALTEMLLKYSKHVYAYEIDKDMYEILNKEFSENRNIDIYLKDFLDVDLSRVEYKNNKINICSNLPYYVTTPILFKLFESELNIHKITVMVQKEVADRFKAEVGSEDYGALSVEVQYLFEVKQEMFVSKNVFYPSPKVDSAVVSFTPIRKRDYGYEKEFFELVKKCFAKRRKTLFNNLRDFLDKEIIDNIYKECNLKQTVRAQELTLQDFVNIYEATNGR